MAARHIPLGARPVNAAADTTGLNKGNWTAVIGHETIGVTVPVFELYHLYLTSPTLVGQATTATVRINLDEWDITLIGQANSWDPSQPPLLGPGDDVFILFNVPTSNRTVPTAYAWFRYER